MSEQNEKTYLHGKQVSAPRTLDEVWGTNRKDIYEVDTEDAYEQFLNKLNKIDLYEHAAMVGVRPTNVNNRRLIVRKLITEFKKYQASKNRTYTPKSNMSNIEKEDAKQRVRNILR